MPLSRALMRQATHPQRIAWSSAIIGIAFCVVFVSVLIIFTWHKREQQHQALLVSSRENLQQTMNTLTATLMPLLPLSELRCNEVERELTSRAAFTENLRAILLVKNGTAYCSSATGAFSLPVSVFSPHTDLFQTRDLNLLSDTSLQPGSPVLTLWLRNPEVVQSGVLATFNISLAPYQLLASYHPEISGIALVARHTALTSWQPHVLPDNALPQPVLMSLALPGYPLKFVLYGSTLSARDYELIILSGILLSLLVAIISGVLMNLHHRPGKEIILGIKRGEFHVEYQPLFTSHDTQPYGMEALLRWTRPGEGAVPPDVFINYAESQNLIIPLTRHLFRLVARDAHQLCHHVPAGSRMSLNVSPLHLGSPSFREDVLHWLSEMPSGHFNYVFEITERTVVHEKNASETFAWLHQHDIKIAIDDFGTGHSALIYLEKYPFDYIKIDRGFVQSIGTETLTSPVLDAVLHLAKKLNLKTVAEGVETGDQATWLINRGVTHLQGFLFSRPLKPERLIAWYQR